MKIYETQNEEIMKKLQKIEDLMGAPFYRYEVMFIRFADHAWRKDESRSQVLDFFICPECQTTLEFTSQLSYTLTYGPGCRDAKCNNQTSIQIDP